MPVTLLIIPDAIWRINSSFVHREGEKLITLILIKAGFRIRIRIQSGQWIRIRRNPDPGPGGQK